MVENTFLIHIRIIRWISKIKSYTYDLFSWLIFPENVNCKMNNDKLTGKDDIQASKNTFMHACI